MLVEFILLVCLLAAYGYFRIKRRFRYWQSKGVPGPEPKFPIGCMPYVAEEALAQTKNVNVIGAEQYQQFKNEKFYGAYVWSTPTLHLQDLDLIQRVLVKDFSHFVDRDGPVTRKIFGTDTPTDRLWQKQMVSLTGDAWKDVRSAFSPIFTSGKLKHMKYLMDEITKKLVGTVSSAAEDGKAIEMKSVLGRFSMDIVSSCAFGVDSGCLNSKEKEPTFITNAANIFMRGGFDLAKILTATSPGGLFLMNAINLPVFKPDETKFFGDIIKATLDHRRKTKERRNDIIDLMLDAIRHTDNHGDGAAHESEEDEHEGSKLNHKAKKDTIDEETVIASAMVVMIAGYDTTAQTMSWMAYEMAKQPEIQEKLHNEVNRLFEEVEDEECQFPDYYAIQGLEYMDKVFHETLRMHPVLGLLQRAVTSSEGYTLPGTDVHLNLDDEVYISVNGIHHDERYYPEPEKFDPERFTKENKAKRHPCAYLPFGTGPRNCVGMRFAMLEAKLGMAALLRKFSFSLSEESRLNNNPLELDPLSLLGAPKDGIWLHVKERN